MDHAFLITLTLTGFAVAFLHAVIPTHWLPFVMVARSRNWTAKQTLAAVALAGGGHVLVTAILGVVVARLGAEISHEVAEVFHWLAAAILIALGGWLAFRRPHGHGCHHCQGKPRNFIPEATDRAALWALFLTLTLSPCELFLPIYLTAVPYGWAGIVWLSVVLAVATLTGMLMLTWLTLRGIRIVPWRAVGSWDSQIFGGALCLLGIASAVMAH